MSSAQALAGILIDLDGVLYIGNEPIPGAIHALETLNSHGIACRFVTNTSTKKATVVAEKLRSLGFAINDEEIFSAVSATRDYLRRQKASSVHLLIGDAVKAEFEEFEQLSSKPEYVVVGDIGASWDYEILNSVFNELFSGATLIAMHKNKYWQTAEGMRMDIGAFVAGLEFVTDKQAVIIGKPETAFFDLAKSSLPKNKGVVLMVGDDIENDIGGGQSAGLEGVLVKTGKYRVDITSRSTVKPRSVIDSFADLPALLQSQGYI